ncbi:putative membrane protein [Sphingomonas kaistensis]|uniref:Putative membrane protein n=1 Tax=Sphingomonas kaistensis TaxID=298708 RepID=A0A7X5Y3M6_9SPHN|nr:putative membrane protein [Sphingomonas kaistensis]
MADRVPSVAELAAELLGRIGDECSPAERSVLESLASGHHSHVHTGLDTPSFGERLADRVARVGGSWGFIISFTLVLLGWMLLNTDVLNHWGLVFDPYPFIFLNLMLSTLAAIQAPIIMMSQNRQSHKDRQDASVDFETNIRAELSIAQLHQKVDLLLDKADVEPDGRRG